MPKIKTHRGAAKRFGVTKNGKVNKKTTKRKRHLRKGGYLSSANEATIKSMMPYK